MPKSSVHLDAAFTLAPHGPLKKDAWKRWKQPLLEASTALRALRSSGEQGWMDLPSDRDVLSRVQAMVAKTKERKQLLVLGIGGSDLGARAILHALSPSKQVLFAGSNTDPDELADIFSLVDWNDVAVNVISKSGDTVEPMSAFLVARERLKQALGKGFGERIVATTDVSQGTLNAWAAKEGYHRLVVPQNVGGRYSVLSDVGLFPAAWAGVDVKALRQGAQSVVEAWTKQKGERWFEAYAGIHAELYQKHGRNLFVFMPYAAQASSFALWWCQLIGESLGKSLKVGPTPIPVQGATDQHSQLQLYMDGPKDKVITFLEVDAFRQKIRVPALPMETPLLKGLVGKEFSDLIHAERKATAEALAQAKRPNLTIHVPKMEAFHLGELFQGFMFATGILGQLLKVNAYDQPGVEDGKKRFRSWLHS